MTEVLPCVWKKILKRPAKDAAKIDLLRTRVIYHRNFYVEGEDLPFDSTYLKNKKDTICLSLNEGLHLPGFLQALETMKEGERSYFIIGYQQMFKELGCPPRVRIQCLKDFL